MKVAIIGAVNVGSSLAFALLIKGGVSELQQIYLSKNEEEKLNKSSEVIKNMLKQIDY